MILKKITFKFLILCFLVSSQTFAVIEEIPLFENPNIIRAYPPYEQQDIVQTSNKNKEKLKTISYIGGLPRELIIATGDFLKHDLHSLQAFAITSSSHYHLIMSNTLYNFPLDQKNAIKELEKTPFNQVRFLGCFWKKGNMESTRTFLQAIRKEYYGYCSPQPLPKKAFQAYVKTLGILYAWGDKTTIEDFKMLYETVQGALNETIDYSDSESTQVIAPENYIYHFKNFAILNPQVREDLVNKYRKGCEPFPHNERKAEKYEQKLLLPLNSDIAYSD